MPVAYNAFSILQQADSSLSGHVDLLLIVSCFHLQAKVENGVLKIVVPKSADHGPVVTDVPIE